jgi:ribosomal-protein-alanine N-acetyltransferase
MATASRARRIEIVPMRLSDLDQVMEIERASFAAPWSRQVFIEELERDWARVDVLVDRTAPPTRAPAQRVIGFVNYWLVRDEVHILNVATQPSERQKGHGARLVAHVIEFARRHACRYVTLEVRRGNVAALKLYRTYGFRAVGLRPNYYVEEREDAIVMVLDLAPPADGDSSTE